MTKIVGLFLQDADYSISISEYHDGGMQVFFDVLKPKNYEPRFEIKCLKKQYDLNENETTLYINSTPKSVLTVRLFEDLIGEIQFSPLLPYQEVQKLGALLTDQKIGFSVPEIKKEFVSNLKKDVLTRKLSLMVGAIAVARQINPTSYHHSDVSRL